MVELADLNTCIGCGACRSICPKSAITMVENREGFLYPQIDSKKCISCMGCTWACPVIGKCNDQIKDSSIIGAINRDSDIRRRSSSGGVFYELVRCFFLENPTGIVYGAAYDEKLNVVHKRIDKLEDVSLLMGSKYVQSEIGDCYIQVRTDLICGLPVYFSGTPCQVAGLKSFLGKDYSGLFTQAILCHGVPSPKVWTLYKEYIENKYNDILVAVNMRDKSHSWESYRMSLQFQSGRKVYDNENLFIRAFGNDLSLRSCCFECKFKYSNYKADITIGDFWNVSNVLKNFYNKYGVSLVFISSEKAKKYVSNIEKYFSMTSVTQQQAMQSAKGIFSNRPIPKKRAIFFSEIDEEKFESLIVQLTKLSLRQTLRIKLGRFYRRFKSCLMNR